MASTHKSLRSSTANKRPTTSIADGQIALNTNTTSPGLFFKDSTGATIIKVGPVHVGTTAPNASPAAGGSSGNSTGEVWLDTSLTPNGVKIWNGASWTNATPIGSTTVQGLLELATNAETQTGTDPDRAVTPAGLQSKVSDSTSTTSSTTIASSTAVKSAYDLANAALPKSGGTVTGNLEIGTTGSLSFEGATADAFETTIAVVDPTADRTITLPDTTGTVVTTGDTGTVTSTMIADGTIVDGDISASAEIAVSKLADGTARQLLQTDAAGTGVEWASNIDVPGTLDVTSIATFDSIASHPLGSAAAPTITFTGDTNTGIYSPGADQVAISTNGSERFRVNATGQVGIGGSPGTALDVIGAGTASTSIRARNDSTSVYLDANNGYSFLNTSSNHPFLIATNNLERLRITSAGLVGVGTSSPAALLHLASATGSATPTPTELRIATTTNAGDWSTTDPWGRISYYSADASAGGPKIQAAIDAISNGAAGTSASFDFKLASNLDATLNSVMRINYLGQVGIGTSSPQHPLHVIGGSSTNNNGANAIAVTGTEHVRLKINTPTTGGYQASLVLSSDEVLSGTSKEVVISTAGSSEMRFATSGSERMRLDSSGRLGIGTASPAELLDVYGTGNTTVRISGSSGGGGDVSQIDFFRIGSNVTSSIKAVRDGGNTSGALTFLTASSGTNSERARLTASGQWLVGTSSSSADAIAVFLGRSSAPGGTGGEIKLAHPTTNVPASGTLGRIQFGNTGDDRGAEIAAIANQTWTSTAKGSYLTFSTTADGAAGPTERMRIDNAGNLLLNATSVLDVSMFTANIKVATNFATLKAPDTNSYMAWQFQNSSGTRVGYIQFSTTATTFSTSSDYRLKENVTAVTDGIARLQQLKPSRFNFIADPDKTVDGFIAHEVQTVVPEAIQGEKDAVDADGNPVYQGIDQSKLVPLLTAALQEAVAKIESLEARLTAAGI